MNIPVKDIVIPRGYDEENDKRAYFRVRELEDHVDYRWDPHTSVTSKMTNPRYREAPLYLSPGTWDLNSGFSSQFAGEHVSGSGSYTVLRSNGASTMWTISHDKAMIRGVRFFDNGKAVSRMISVSGASSVIIDSCSFIFSSGSTGIAISLTDCDNVAIRNCNFAFGSAGIYLLDCDNAIITGNRIRGISRSAGNHAINLDSTGTGSASTRCNDCIVSGNHVSSVGSIRYNTSGSHLVGDSTVSGHAKLNNVSATHTAY